MTELACLPGPTKYPVFPFSGNALVKVVNGAPLGNPLRVTSPLRPSIDRKLHHHMLHPLAGGHLSLPKLLASSSSTSSPSSSSTTTTNPLLLQLSDGGRPVSLGGLDV